jgi:cytochrome P450
MDGLAVDAVRELPRDRPVDLLAAYAQPWCLSLAMLVTGADPADRERLAALSREVLAGTGQPEDSPVRMRAAEATAELERIFNARVARMGEPTMVGISQTLPRMLANAWVALLRHPSEWERLRADPGLMTGGFEELLRFASIVPALFRRAMEDVDIAGVHIHMGEQVHLRVGSANRDPEQFPDPDRLDVTRPFTANMTLGNGRNSCVGAMLIRMAGASTTRALLDGLPHAELVGDVEWQSGSGFCWPTAVYVKGSA